MDKEATRRGQVRALLTVLDIPLYYRGSTVNHSHTYGQPFFIVSNFITARDTHHHMSERLVLIELCGLDSPVHVIDDAPDYDDPYDRLDIIERLVSRLDYRKLGALQRQLLNLTR